MNYNAKLKTSLASYMFPQVLFQRDVTSEIRTKVNGDLKKGSLE